MAGGSGAAVQRKAEELTREEVQRYSRHLIMPEVGVEGQRKLKAARVLCIGAGGLGAPAAMYLAAAGVGTLGLVDFDVVDCEQPAPADHLRHAGRRPAQARSRRASGSGDEPGVNVVLHEVALTSKNALDVLRDYDVIVDGTDNFPTRYLVNDACVLLGKPNVYGSIFRFDGQASVFAVKGGPCYRCLYPEPPPPGLVPSCAEGGVLGVLPGIIGIIQATEAIKLILGAGQPLVGRLLLYDALQMRFRELKLRRDPECPVCGDHPTIHALIDYDAVLRRRAGAERAAGDAGVPEVTVEELKAQDRSRRRRVHPGRARAERVSDLPDPGVDVDPARRAVAAGPRNSIAIATSIVHCKMGARSAKAVALLQERGFTRVSNLKGGILAWIDRVDPSQSKDELEVSRNFKDTKNTDVYGFRKYRLAARFAR